MRHADDEHRATSDPSEGHAVKTGEREADLLGIANGDVEDAVLVLFGARLRRQIVIAGIPIGNTGNDLAALVSAPLSSVRPASGPSSVMVGLISKVKELTAV